MRLFRVFSWSIATVGLAVMIGCGAGNNSYSGSATATNFTGFYDVRSANPSAIAARISAITLTQTGNFVRIIDNNGVIYEGNTNSSEITLFDARDSAADIDEDTQTPGVSDNNHNLTQTYTVTGVAVDGKPVTMHLVAQFTIYTLVDQTTGLVSASPYDQADLTTTSVRIVALQGNYVETGGLVGTIIFETNIDDN